MKDKYFSYGDVLGFGWNTMKNNFWFFVSVGIIWFVISYIPTTIELIAKHTLPKESLALALIKLTSAIIGWVIGIIFAIGLIKIALSFCDEQMPTVGTLFDAWDCFWRYFAGAFLFGLIVLGGLILFIIPGIIWSIKFSLFPYFVVEHGMGPIEALKASSQTTMGVKFELFGFGILCGLINMLGVFCLLVGMFATYPTVIVAMALVYRQLLAQTSQLNESDTSESTDWTSHEDSESSHR